jgi:pantoate--beta-alanine ligase
MGAFHDGHLDLMRQAKQDAATVVVSLFVNPTQFSPGEDLGRYPRNEAKDFELAESVGVDTMFAPTAETLYANQGTTVHPSSVGLRFEGERRPGHFAGVCTIVSKLFHLVSPDIAYFGLKDLQQCSVLHRMVIDLDFGLQLRFMPTTREVDGLAMSSRNAYLSHAQRETAPALFQELKRIGGLETHQAILNEIPMAKERLTRLGFELDYLDLIDVDRFDIVDNFAESTAIVAAAKLGNTRLIDNLLIRPPSNWDVVVQ